MDKGDIIFLTIIAILTVVTAVAITDSIKEEEITIQTEEITELKKQVNSLEKENKELEEKYLFEKQQAEYWYYFNVNDCC